MGTILLLLLIFACGLLSTALKGYVLTVVWGWFAVEHFSADPLTFAQAVSVVVIMTFLTHQVDWIKGNDWDCLTTNEKVSYVKHVGGELFIMPLTFWSMAWLIKTIVI